MLPDASVLFDMSGDEKCESNNTKLPILYHYKLYFFSNLLIVDKYKVQKKSNKKSNEARTHLFDKKKQWTKHAARSLLNLKHSALPHCLKFDYIKNNSGKNI